jgi:hypothetical protein
MMVGLDTCSTIINNFHLNSLRLFFCRARVYQQKNELNKNPPASLTTSNSNNFHKNEKTFRAHPMELLGYRAMCGMSFYIVNNKFGASDGSCLQLLKVAPFCDYSEIFFMMEAMREMFSEAHAGSTN